MENYQHAKSYSKAYQRDYGFEAVMVAARQRLVLEILRALKPRMVVEIGCGPVLLYDRACALKLPVKQWIIVEPCSSFLRSAKEKNIPLRLIHGFFEEMADDVRTVVPQGADLVICSGMLNEVRNPGKLLKEAAQILAKNGHLHVNVPNSGSLHRRLGVVMKLIKRLPQSSQRNKRLRQYHVFDQESLHKLVCDSGFTIETSGGYFLKPFAHKQMQAIRPVLSKSVLDGLWILGRQFPELATEIYVNACRKSSKGK